MATYIKLSEKELKKMLIKSLRDDAMLEIFNYLEQPLSEMILSMIRKEKHLMKIGLWGHKRDDKPPPTKVIAIVVATKESQGAVK